MKNQLALTLLCFLLSTTALARYEFLDGGDIVEQEKYRLTASTQFNFSDSLLGVAGRMDIALTDASEFQVKAGIGASQLHAGAFFKWVPFPDTEEQPALGLTAGAQVSYLSNHMDFTSDVSEISIRVIPFMSKHLASEVGPFQAYAALPINLSFVKDKKFGPAQLTLGTRYSYKDWKESQVLAEAGFDLNDAFSYFSVGYIWTFSAQAGESRIE